MAMPGLRPLYFSLTTNKQGRPRFCMNSRSPVANLFKKSSEIETILMKPTPYGSGTRLTTSPATRGRYSTLAHPVALGGYAYT